MYPGHVVGPTVRWALMQVHPVDLVIDDEKKTVLSQERHRNRHLEEEVVLRTAAKFCV